MLLALVTLPLLWACSPPPPADAPLRAVRTMTVQPGQAGLTHDYAAEIRARTESRLGFQVGGKLVERMVNLGDQVAAGRALARIDTRDLALGQQAARASVQAAQVQVDLNQADYQRYKELRDKGFISGAELERRETTLKASRAALEQARAQAGVQDNQAGYAVLTAGAAGVVTSVDAEPGAVLAAGTSVLRLAHDGPRDAVFSVPEDRVDSVRALLGKAGALALKPWGAADKPLPATVREVSAAADPATRTFLVKADIGSAALRLGQTATVAIAAPLGSAVIKLPLQALFERGGKPMVWRVDRASMVVQARPVTVAGAEGNLVLIGQGLAAGESVVTAGVHTLNEGQKVRWYQEPAAAAAPATAHAIAAASAPAASVAASGTR
ncbi:efflux RND transporter periplasmic adaptor subunit [Aquabacterium sp. OR-4]|uniref:efflux RND transporter periplasmic adaptor subunit n=1 Tax=Aquabacterium sp. OR-4 TaxID=2978127 RepID=UPI0028C79CC6|nr:efflux RND transporter periplasmic adaptor subunit [Aquabacterium sp. OR-4]MDT7835242.1 efflux RND transporter periplasmic adaptor subunit [Aquabacterium sp. OR-4]